MQSNFLQTQKCDAFKFACQFHIFITFSPFIYSIEFCLWKSNNTFIDKFLIFCSQNLFANLFQIHFYSWKRSCNVYKKRLEFNSNVKNCSKKLLVFTFCVVYLLTFVDFYIYLIFVVEFSYRNPEDWKKTSVACGGSHQSPINIPKHVSRLRGFRAHSEFVNYNKVPNKLYLNHTGHTGIIIKS